MQRAFANPAAQAAFADALEQLLRRGEADAALTRVHEALAPFAAAGAPLAQAALACDPAAVVLDGWEQLAETATAPLSGQPITAIGIDISAPGHYGLAPDAEGLLEPMIETNYHADLGELRFSRANRAAILAAYDAPAAAWQANFVHIDAAITVRGMGRLYGAVCAAADRGESDDAAGDLYALGACAAAIILHIAVRRAVRTRGLPRPLAVIVGSNDDFPHFSAPVVSAEEARPFLHPGAASHGPRRDRSARAEKRARRERREVPDFSEFPEMAEFARLAEAQFERVRKPRDILPALGAVGLMALTQYLRQRK